MEIIIAGFVLMCIWVIYCIVQYKIDLGELFMQWILKYKYNWIVTFLFIISVSVYVYDTNVYKQRTEKLQFERNAAVYQSNLFYKQYRECCKNAK